MCEHIEDIIGLFHKEKAIRYKLEEIRLEEDDSRWVLFVDFPKNQFVIKIAANDFTSKERIDGWVEIIDTYRSLGYYRPSYPYINIFPALNTDRLRHLENIRMTIKS